MIRHIVLIKFNADLPEAEITDIWRQLHALRGHIPGLLSLTSGRSESPEQIERGYMHGFVADFESWDALQTYADDSEHKKLGARLVANAQGGIDGLLVFDFAVKECA